MPTFQPCAAKDDIVIRAVSAMLNRRLAARGRGWPRALSGVPTENQLVLGGNPTQCTRPPPAPGCQPPVQHGRDGAYHYVILGRARLEGRHLAKEWRYRPAPDH